MNEEFLEKRRKELESYLQTVFELEIWLQRRKQVNAMSRDFSLFLDFTCYEVHGILENLAAHLCDKGDSILGSTEAYEISPLQLFALCERIKLPEPSFPGPDRKYDFSHVIDFVHRLKHLKIEGSDKSIGSSNIKMNSLPFSLQTFKSLESLWVESCSPEMITGLEQARKTVLSLVVHSTLKELKEILVDTEVDMAPGQTHSNIWNACTTFDCSANFLTSIDHSVTALRHVCTLNLSGNELKDIAHLQHLPALNSLDLSRNQIEKIDSWHTKLGNVTNLNLAGNRITCLKGLRKLYSIEVLDCSENRLMQPKHVWWLGRLPCLTTVHLTGNPVESSVEYRTRVLEAFGSRVAEVKLDGKKASERELDTIGVRLAIRKAREDKERILRKAKEDLTRNLEPDPPASYYKLNNNHESYHHHRHNRVQQQQQHQLGTSAPTTTISHAAGLGNPAPSMTSSGKPASHLPSQSSSSSSRLGGQSTMTHRSSVDQSAASHSLSGQSAMTHRSSVDQSAVDRSGMSHRSPINASTTCDASSNQSAMTHRSSVDQSAVRPRTADSSSSSSSSTSSAAFTSAPSTPVHLEDSVETASSIPFCSVAGGDGDDDDDDDDDSNRSRQNSQAHSGQASSGSAGVTEKSNIASGNIIASGDVECSKVPCPEVPTSLRDDKFSMANSGQDSRTRGKLPSTTDFGSEISKLSSSEVDQPPATAQGQVRDSLLQKSSQSTTTGTITSCSTTTTNTTADIIDQTGIYGNKYESTAPLQDDACE